MIIECPNCQTRYQVAEKAIGSAGRKVQCANCKESWQAVAIAEEPAPKPKLVETPAVEPKKSEDEDRLFDKNDEEALDNSFAAEEQKQAAKKAAAQPAEADAAGESPAKDKKKKSSNLDPSLKTKRQKEMVNRQRAFAKNLPMGRLRNNVRLGLVAFLVLLAAGAALFRTDIVRTFPELAGVYEKVGLSVNIIGLEFIEVETLLALKDGTNAMIVSGGIQNITSRQVKVPIITVEILDGEGVALHEWKVTPSIRLIGPQEAIEFETQLNAAPQEAQSIKLGFEVDRAN